MALLSKNIFIDNNFTVELGPPCADELRKASHEQQDAKLDPSEGIHDINTEEEFVKVLKDWMLKKVC